MLASQDFSSCEMDKVWLYIAYFTPSTVHLEKIRIHLCETATNSTN